MLTFWGCLWSLFAPRLHLWSPLLPPLVPHPPTEEGNDKDDSHFSFVRINVPKQGVSILKLKSPNVTIGEILAMVQKKRALPTGQHALELLNNPGVELPPDARLRDLGTNELLLIHKFSMVFLLLRVSLSRSLSRSCIQSRAAALHPAR